MRPLILDTETASLDGGCVDLAIRLIDVDTLDTVEEWESLIDPERPISPQASGIHHITDADVYYSPTLREYLAMSGEPLQGDQVVVIAHNAAFDCRILHDELPENHKRLCTLKLSRMAWPDMPDHKLQTLRYVMGLDAGTAHRAMGDVRACHGLLLELAKHYNTGLAGLLELSSRTLSPDTKITFGKHKGKAIKDLPKDYVRWLLDPERSIDPDLKEALKKL